MFATSLSEPVFETHFELNDHRFTTTVNAQRKEYRLEDVIGIRARYQDQNAGRSPIDRLYLRVQDPVAPIIEVQAGHSGMDQTSLANLLDEVSKNVTQRIFEKLRDDQNFYNGSWVLSPTELLNKTEQTDIPLAMIGEVTWGRSDLTVRRLDTGQPFVICDVLDENAWALGKVLRHIVEHGPPKPEPLRLRQTQAVAHTASPSTATQASSDLCDPPIAAVDAAARTAAAQDAAPSPVTIKCKVKVRSEPSSVAKGQFACDVVESGLRLTKRHEVIIIPRGQMVHHTGDNRIVVDFPDRRLHLSVKSLWSYQQRLARDIVAFLNNEAEPPRQGNYDLPVHLGVIASLPLGIPVVTLGGALPALAGVGLSGVCFAVARNESLPESVRLMLVLAMSGAGYLALIAGLSALGSFAN